MKFAMSARIDTVNKKAQKKFPTKYLCKDTQKVIDFYKSRPYASKISVKLKDEIYPRTYEDFNCFSDTGFADDSAMSGIHETVNLFIAQFIKDEKPFEMFCSSGNLSEFNPDDIEYLMVYIKNATVHHPKAEFYVGDTRYSIPEDKIKILDERDNKKYKSIPVHRFTGLKGYIDMGEIAVKRGERIAKELGITDPEEKEELCKKEVFKLSSAIMTDVKKFYEEVGDDIEMD